MTGFIVQLFVKIHLWLGVLGPSVHVTVAFGARHPHQIGQRADTVNNRHD